MSTTTHTSKAAAQAGGGGAVRLQLYAMDAILVVQVMILDFTAPGFDSLDNLLNVLRTVSMLGIIAFGMTAVIISGEIDLSVGAGVALAGCIVAWVCGTLTDPLGPVTAVILGAVAAIAVGTLSGVFTG